MSALTALEAGRARATVFLQPGHLHVAGDPTTITTILASCVAVCLFDTRRKIGGMNHFLLPQALMADRTPAKFGVSATQLLLDQLLAMGCRRRDLQAKVFGGATVIAALAAHREHMPLGEANAHCAFDFLRDAGIPVIASDIGGKRGRKIIFHTDDGSALMKFL
jgi:chemotaxis protein CheD